MSVAETSFAYGVADQLSERVVDGPAPVEGGLLDLAVPAYAQQQGHRREVVDQDLHRRADGGPQPVSAGWSLVAAMAVDRGC